MGLNPFKDSNLENLQQIITDFLFEKFGFIQESTRIKWKIFQKKTNERLTIMLIPHSEKKLSISMYRFILSLS